MRPRSIAQPEKAKWHGREVVPFFSARDALGHAADQVGFTRCDGG